MTALRWLGLALVGVLVMLGLDLIGAPTADATGRGLPSSVLVFHDADRGVTCWLYFGHLNKGGISCLPDDQLRGER